MCLMVLACYWPFQREPGIDDVQMGLREAERRGGVGGRAERPSGGPGGRQDRRDGCRGTACALCWSGLPGPVRVSPARPAPRTLWAEFLKEKAKSEVQSSCTLRPSKAQRKCNFMLRCGHRLTTLHEYGLFLSFKEVEKCAFLCP